MNRETRIGIFMVLILVGVFGFLFYKRAMRPAEAVAKADAAESEDDPNDEELAPPAGNDFPDEEENETEPAILPVAGRARPVPQEEPEEEDDPFSKPETPATAKSRPTLPTMIPEPEEEFAEDDNANPPGDGPSDRIAVDSSPSFAASDPETDENDPFTDGTEVVEPDEEPALTTRTAPLIEFETQPEEEAEDFAAEEPVLQSPPPKSPPPKSPPPKSPPVMSSFDSTDDQEDTISVRARTELPEQAIDFGESETESEEVMEEFEPSGPSQPAAVPQILFDDSSDEDRYGGYEPAEFPADDTVDGRRETTSIAGNRHVVQAGENLWSISQKKYGTGKYFQALALHNHQRIPDAGKMKPGVEVALPSAEELERRYAAHINHGGPKEPAAASGSPGGASGDFFLGNDNRPMYRVGAGDTLSGIAQRYLGRARRWEQLLEMNRDVLKDGNSLKVGAVLRLPNDATQLKLSNQPRDFR